MIPDFLRERLRPIDDTARDGSFWLTVDRNGHFAIARLAGEAWEFASGVPLPVEPDLYKPREPLPEFLRTDVPAVRETQADAPGCRTCHFWSQWLEHTGDCLLYALRRHAALIEAEDMSGFHAEWPQKAARATADTETCDGWQERQR